ncbi:hypothetical protein [Paracoccus zhejiangensis]|uniref:YceI family protein n=1 Tax=Paracoccus zhejiangensis TaxID=1077935 RepID=A0A2H5F0I0_9RHOB|nr:hypothetical protein [Paracoccus zhejiangensis]AUH65061.1 hypothetical protein CX676_13490 [Paracoccus zhejiangensis]
MKKTICLALALLLAPIAPAHAGEAGDAVFAERGPWSLGDKTLVWSETVKGPEAEGFRAVEGGTLTLSETIDPSDGKPVLQINHDSNDFERKVGPFPISGGDPVLTFFLERTARDMAALTGGSPFYIRNRMKDALFGAGSLSRDGDTVEARFKPFESDPNAARMNGFETLELVFTIGGPKAPIRELLAQTAGDSPGYVNHLVMQ